jgi:hypothetical protein
MDVQTVQRTVHRAKNSDFLMVPTSSPKPAMGQAEASVGGVMEDFSVGNGWNRFG